MVAGRWTGGVIKVACVAACAMLACVVVLRRPSPRALASTFPSCAIPPCSQPPSGSAEADRLAAVIKNLKSKLSKLKTMMGDWSNTVENFGKDQRMLLRDLADKRKKVTRDEHAEKQFLRTPALILKKYSQSAFFLVYVPAR